ncbi:MAG: threonylcarbamoyl-AMP synthase [Deltaproteobacteria bacterium]|nr:threonylcarbamoyl-AMP synthase [Candidatus Anaeroferrophillacea bacterium]
MTVITWHLPPDNECGAEARIAAVLGAGGIGVFPTETVYGIGGIATDPAVITRLFALKGRDPGKPFPVLVSSTAMLETLAAEISPAARSLIGRFWPGALTLVFWARPELPPGCRSGADTVAVRFSPHPLLRRIIARLGRPLIATSANLSGDPPPADFATVPETLKQRADIIIDGGPCAAGRPSTLLDVTVDPPRILRRGAVDILL